MRIKNKKNRKNRKNRKNKEIRVALRNLAVLYNRTAEIRDSLLLEFEDEKISAS